MAALAPGSKITGSERAALKSQPEQELLIFLGGAASELRSL